MVGLSTPLHLAASLLALFAAAGLAIVVLARAGRRGGDLLVAVGALAYAAGQALAGALLGGSGDVVAWLRAAGLVAIALGVTPWRLSSIAGPAVVIPAVPPVPALIGAIAGTVAGVRALVAGRPTLPVGLGLLAWGGAEALTQVSVTASAWTTVLGALLVGGYLWAASARRLLAKFVTAFIVALLGVVVLMAGVLSGFVEQSLVREELRRLDDAAEQLVTDLTVEWRRDALNVAQPLSNAAENLLAIDPEDEASLAAIYSLSFSAQDFFVLLGPDGRVVSSYSPGDALGESFALRVAGSALVDELVTGVSAQGSDVATIGGQFVALGAVRLVPPGFRAEDAPLGLLVTGRVLDPVRVSQLARERGVGIVVEIGGSVSAASQDVAGIADAVAAELSGEDSAVVSSNGDLFYAAAAPVTDAGRTLGRIATVSGSGPIVQLERGQARQLFLLTLTGAVFAGLVAAVVTGRLVAPIRRLTAAAAAVREGDLDTQAQVETTDEVGELGRTFNEMTMSLAAQSAQLRTAADVQAQLRARLEALTASMSDALVAVDTAGKVIAFNPAAERLVGRAAEEVSGLPLGEVLRGQGPGDSDPVAAVGAPSSERVVAVQLLLARPDERLVPTAVTAAPVRDESGAVFGRVLVLRDVAREAEVERMKTEFLSNVSHELRTPLTPIKGYAEVLARRDVGRAATREFAGEILDATDRLERIVGMIVDFAGLDSGRIELNPEPTALADLVGETLARWRQRCPSREFRRRIAKSLPPVTVDRAMLRRAVDELLDNAVKFSPGGEPVSVTAHLASGANGRPFVRLSVRDRGVGIEPDTAARVFADFYQVDASETRHYGGLGLGLALVRRIMEGLGGSAEVESDVGAGSTVHLLLPAADVTLTSAGNGQRAR